VDSGTGLSNTSVLIVDDELFFRGLLRDILVSNGFSVVSEAADGVEAVRQFRAHRPDLTIMDIFMPDGNGIEATREILALEPDSRVIICSGVGYDDDIEAALQAGARDIIYKPFYPDEVLKSIAKALEAG
jgi:two-component system chemotaxis response regulator CheY